MKRILLTLIAIFLVMSMGFTQSITLSPTGNNGRQGIGIETPVTQLEVGIPSSGNGISISGIGNGWKAARLSFWSDRLAGNEWRPGFIQSGDNGVFTGRLDFYVNGTGSANKIGEERVMSITHVGVGIGVIDPANKLHIGTGGMTIDHDNSDTDVINFNLINPVSAAGIKFNSSLGGLMGGYYHGQSTTQIFRGTVKNEGISINDANDIGLGNATPIAKLDIPNLSTNDDYPSLRLLHLSSGFNRIKFETLGKTGNFIIASKIESTASDSRLHLYSKDAGNVLSITGDGNIIHEGFTRLGNVSTDAPNIKMKKLTGTLGTGEEVGVVHGLMASKILGIQAIVNNNGSGFYPPSGPTAVNYSVHCETLGCFISDYGSAFHNESYSILLTYEE